MGRARLKSAYVPKDAIDVTAKVLALVPDAFGGRGGIAQYNRDFLTALASYGHQVIAVPRYAPDPVQLPDGVVQRRARAGHVIYSFTALREALRVQPDIVFCGHLFMAPLAWLAAKFAGARLVIQTYGIDAWPRPSRSVRRACEQASIILSISRYTRARVLSWAAVPPERTVVVSTTVSDCFTPGDGAALRREWSLEGKTVLLTVGRMSASERYKGHDRVIAALPGLISAGLDVVYVVAGDGDDRPRLEDLAREANVGSHVRFVGSLSHLALIEAYRTADIFVMPSTGEGFGIVFLEAMACGTPTVGLDVAGARDALCDGDLGHAVKENELGATLARMITTAGPDSHMLSNAVRERFGWDRFAKAVHSAISRTLEP